MNLLTHPFTADTMIGEGDSTLMNAWQELQPHLTVRAPTATDIPAVVELLNRAAHVMTGVTPHSEDELKAEWTVPGHSMEEDIRLVLDGDRPIGMIEVWATRNPPVGIWVWGRVDPDYEGRGIGTAMMTWAEARACDTAFPRVPDGLRISMHAAAPAQYAPASELLANHGMTISRYFWQMRAPLDQPVETPVLPDGLVMRTLAETGDFEAVVRADREAFRDHWGHHDTPWEEDLAEWKHWTSTSPDFDPTIWFLLMEGDEIAGVALCMPKSENDPTIGYVDSLAVRRPWRRRGLGLTLLRLSFAEFQRRGKRAVDLHVDAANPTGATRLYERAGMAVHQTNVNYEKELRAGQEIMVRETFEEGVLLTPQSV